MQSVQIYTQCVILHIVKHCVTSHKCVCDFTHSFSGVANLRYFLRRNFRYNFFTLMCKIFRSQNVLVYNMKNMRYDVDVLYDHDVYDDDDNKDVDHIRSDHFVNSFAMA